MQEVSCVYVCYDVQHMIERSANCVRMSVGLIFFSKMCQDYTHINLSVNLNLNIFSKNVKS